MTALSAKRDTKSVLYLTPRYAVPVAAGAAIYQGAMVAANEDGYLVPASSMPTLCVLGRAAKSYDNSAGTDGAMVADVDSGIHFWGNGGPTAVADADIGSFCYALDDQTVTMSGIGRSIAGIVRDVSDDGVAVDQTIPIGHAVSHALPIAWESQATWYIDPATGDDANSGGDAQHAIATLAELERRLSGRTIGQAVEVFLIGALHEGSLNLSVNFTDGGYVIIYGQRTVLAEGTVSASASWNPSTQTPGWIESLDLPGTWSDYPKALVRFPAKAALIGEAVASSWVMVDQGTGNKRARISPRTIFEAPYGILTPQVGEAFEVCSLTRINGGITLSSSTGKTPGGFIAAINVDADPTDDTVDGLVSTGGVAYFVQCRAGGYDSGARGAATQTSFDTCHIDGYKLTASAGNTILDYGCLIDALNVAPSPNGGAVLTLESSVSQSASLFGVHALGAVEITDGSWAAACDATLGAIVGAHGVADLKGQLWGSNIASTLLQLSKTASCIIHSDAELASTGTLTAPVIVGASTRTVAQANNGHVEGDGTRLVVW